MSGPLCVDLYCGLGGWTEGFLSEGWRVIGFDNERHIYGEHRYPSQLVLQDVRTLHGSQFNGADMIVASSPCQEFSYRAMPWKRAKALGPPYLGMELFAQAERIQREASAAAGRHIPMIQENVKGAQKWVGRARWHYGSYYLWGDVPALMPMVWRGVKSPGRSLNRDADKKFGSHNMGSGEMIAAEFAANDSPIKNDGGSWFNVGSPGQKVTGRNPDGRKLAGDDTVKGVGLGSASWQAKEDRHPNDPRNFYSKSPARKAASARIAKIPFGLASYIARTFYPASR